MASVMAQKLARELGNAMAPATEREMEQGMAPLAMVWVQERAVALGPQRGVVREVGLGRGLEVKWVAAWAAVLESK